MRLSAAVSVAVALAAVAGCSSQGSKNQESVVVDFYAGTTDKSGYPGMGIGAGNVFDGAVGVVAPFNYQPLPVRQCNAANTACALGLVDLASNVSVLSIGPRSATIKVDLSYRVSGASRREWPGKKIVEKVGVPEVINDQGTFSRSAEIPYGQVRKVDLPYGVAFTFCVSPPGTSNRDARPCASALSVRDTSRLEEI